MDEAGYRLGASPRFGCAPRCQDTPGLGVHGKWRTMTMLGAVALDGFRSVITIEAGTSAEVFLAFAAAGPQAAPGDVVVTDNLSAHKAPKVLEVIRARGADVLYLPPYSPELNPIERAWGRLKDIMRRLPTLARDEFDAAVATAMGEVSPADILGWTAFAGYELCSV